MGSTYARILRNCHLRTKALKCKTPRRIPNTGEKHVGGVYYVDASLMYQMMKALIMKYKTCEKCVGRNMKMPA